MNLKNTQNRKIVKTQSLIPKTPVRFILYASKKHKVSALLAITAVILASSAGQATNLIFKLIIDAAESNNLDRALIYGMLFPAAVFGVQFVYRLSGFFAKNWTTGVEKDAYDSLVAYVARHSHGYYINRFSGSILSKVGNVVKATTQFIPDFLWAQLSAVVAFLITFVFIARIDFISGLIFLVLIFVLIGVNKFLAPKKRELSKNAAEASTKLRGNIVDLFSNAAAMRQHVMVQNEVKNIGSDTQEVKNARGKSWFYSEKMLIFNSSILFVFTLAIFYILVTRWSVGDISTGEFIFIIALVSQITGSLIFIGRAFNDTAQAFGEAEEGLNDLLLPHEIVDSKNAKPLVQKGGEIIWSNVSFKYEDNDVFKKFNLTIQPGERVGLVGSSGAGKTTFVSLMLRQHEIDAGEISIDGQNIAHVTQDSLRQHIAVVPQEPMLFHRSIRENIAYGKPRATKAEIIAVAKKAEAHDFIMSLSRGYDTLVGERGVKLSGGQKQRIAIARAMLKDAPILILDEATSALDSESEVTIQKALHKLMAGKTVIAIAHRLSTLREMDRIIVLENGKIKEDGSHESLVKKGGIYAKLWAHQAGGFLQA